MTSVITSPRIHQPITGLRPRPSRASHTGTRRCSEDRSQGNVAGALSPCHRALWIHAPRSPRTGFVRTRECEIAETMCMVWKGLWAVSTLLSGPASRAQAFAILPGLGFALGSRAPLWTGDQCGLRVRETAGLAQGVPSGHIHTRAQGTALPGLTVTWVRLGRRRASPATHRTASDRPTSRENWNRLRGTLRRRTA